jgi:hypothetical protein
MLPSPIGPAEYLGPTTSRPAADRSHCCPCQHLPPPFIFSCTRMYRNTPLSRGRQYACPFVLTLAIGHVLFSVLAVGLSRTCLQLAWHCSHEDNTGVHHAWVPQLAAVWLANTFLPHSNSMSPESTCPDCDCFHTVAPLPGCLPLKTRRVVSVYRYPSPLLSHSRSVLAIPFAARRPTPLVLSQPLENTELLLMCIFFH